MEPKPIATFHTMQHNIGGFCCNFINSLYLTMSPLATLFDLFWLSSHSSTPLTKLLYHARSKVAHLLVHDFMSKKTLHFCLFHVLVFSVFFYLFIYLFVYLFICLFVYLFILHGMQYCKHHQSTSTKRSHDLIFVCTIMFDLIMWPLSASSLLFSFKLYVLTSYNILFE